MKKPRRTLYKISIGLITLFIFYAGFASRKEYGNDGLFFFIAAISFGYTSYMRFYLMYKIEKLKGEHNYIDFIEYINNYLAKRALEFVIPLPILDQQKTKEQKDIKFTFNILTVITYLLFGLMIILSSNVKK